MFLLGGWQDGATAVCVWVLGQTVSVMILFEDFYLFYLKNNKRTL